MKRGKRKEGGEEKKKRKKGERGREERDGEKGGYLRRGKTIIERNKSQQPVAEKNKWPHVARGG